MSEKALAIPFESPEIVDILCAEFRKRLESNCHLQGQKEYASFRASFDVTLVLRGVSGITVDTIAWDKPYRDPVVPDTEGEVITAIIPSDVYESKQPNAERMQRGMPVTVTDKRGNKRKVHVTDAEAVSASPKIDG